MRLRTTFLMAWIAALLLLPSLSQAQWFTNRDLLPRGPKTLLEWSNSTGDEEEGEGGLYGDRIITDRPHIAEAASLVGLGRVQIETGYTYFLDRDGGTRIQTHSYPESLFRIGLFREWFEFRFQYNYLIEQTDDPLGRTVLSGSDDLYIGAKLALAEQHGILPELTVFPQFRAPIGGSPFSAREVLPGMNFVYAWQVTDRFELECNTQVNRRRDPGIDHFYTEILQTVNLEYDLTEKVMLFHEFVIFSPVGAIVSSNEYYIHPGFHYFILPNLQLDVHAAVGLNRAADDLFGGSGISWRW